MVLRCHFLYELVSDMSSMNVWKVNISQMSSSLKLEVPYAGRVIDVDNILIKNIPKSLLLVRKYLNTLYIDALVSATVARFVLPIPCLAPLNIKIPCVGSALCRLHIV